MNAIDRYRQELRRLEEWRDFLCANSRLPGPRANLELLEAAVREGDTTRFLELVAGGEADACGSAASEFLVVCGLVGLGSRVGGGEKEHLPVLRAYATDGRWRVREAVAMGLQHFGDAAPGALLDELRDWSGGSPLEARAVVAAVCEPRLLRPEFARAAIGMVERITRRLAATPREERTADHRVLRQALGYGWSVLVAAQPEDGRPRFEATVVRPADPDLRWVARENLKKKRLERQDPAWVERMRRAVA